MKLLGINEKGFSLIELMVAMVIIGVLVAVAIPVYYGVQRTAAESAHDANVRTLKGAASVWYAEHGAIAVGNLQPASNNSDYGILLINGNYQEADSEEDGIEGSYFGNYIEKTLPDVPAIIAGSIDWGLLEPDIPHYYVAISRKGEIIVEPDIGAYGS